MSEFGDDSIYFNKNTIDSEKYFQLFDKYIPVFNKTSNILIFSISNPVAIMHMMKKNPEARYIIVDEKETFSVIQILTNDHNFECVYINIDDFDWYNINMKFDCIIMNPPYSRNLHLKILEQAIKQLKPNDNSIVINISPSDWLINKFGEYCSGNQIKYFREELGSHLISDLEIFSNEFTNNIFNIRFYNKLGIGVYSYNKTNYNFNKFLIKDPIINKVLNKIKDMPSLRSCFSKYINSDLFVQVRRRTHNYLKFIDFNNNKIKDGILFKTKKERDNFIKTFDTWLYSWLNLFPPGENSAFAPSFKKEINPRTGLVGYNSEWTDDDFFRFFNISLDEQKIIKKSINKNMI